MSAGPKGGRRKAGITKGGSSSLTVSSKWKAAREGTRPS